MLVWIMISAAIRILLVALVIMIYSSMLFRNQNGYTKNNPPGTYITMLTIVGTFLYIFHFIFPT